MPHVSSKIDVPPRLEIKNELTGCEVFLQVLDHHTTIDRDIPISREGECALAPYVVDGDLNAGFHGDVSCIQT